MLNVYLCLKFFFFKQKTAYEVRISDWSSDVCSSDLPAPLLGVFQGEEDLRHRDVVAGERFLVGVGEADLAGGGSRLLFLQPQHFLGEAEVTAPDGDGAGRHQQHLGAPAHEGGDNVGQGVEPVTASSGAPDTEPQYTNGTPYDA